MAGSLPSPPVSAVDGDTEAAPDKNSTDLVEKLDRLLEQYLGLLDTYQNLRDRLNGDCAKGFLSLAQTQRNAGFGLGNGRRYGEAGYDMRMKAQRILNLELVELQAGLEGREEQCSGEQDAGAKGSKVLKASIRKPVPAQAVIETAMSERPSSLPGEVDFIKESNVSENSSHSACKEERTDQMDNEIPPGKLTPLVSSAGRDPLQWFGVLVPLALRNCQASFVQVVEDAVPKLVNVESEMAQLEKEIWICREQLGILDQYDLDDRVAPSRIEETSRSDIVREDIEKARILLSTSSSLSSSVHKNVVSRPAHAKAPLLKLGD